MKEKEEDEERNENICLQTDTQVNNQRIKKLRPPYPLWSVDRRGSGQIYFNWAINFKLVKFSGQKILTASHCR